MIDTVYLAIIEELILTWLHQNIITLVKTIISEIVSAFLIGNNEPSSIVYTIGRNNVLKAKSK